MKNNRHYILRGQEPVRCPDLLEWAKGMVETDLQVGLTAIGRYTVSTMFLGVDIGHSGVPLLFETMVLEDNRNTGIYTGRCATWADAEALHRSAVERVNLLTSPTAPESTPL